jgi:AAA15 family ATPase/GTPase
MITSITLENFKCFRKVEVNPRRITAFVGPNGTGKSSVLQALGLLKQSLGQDHLNVRGPLVHFRNADQLEPNFYETGGPFWVSFAGFYKIPEIPFRDFGSIVEFTYESEFEGETLTNNWGRVEFIRGKTKYTIEFDYEGNLKGIPPPPLQGLPLAPQQKRIIAQAVENSSNEGILGSFIDREILASPSRVLDGLRLVPATRGADQPVYRLGHSAIDDVSLEGDLSRQWNQVATNLAYKYNLMNKVSAWLKRITGMGLRVELLPPQDSVSLPLVEVKSLSQIGEVNVVAEGFGTNALILLFMQLASASKGATVLIEEPEIHLHPKAQAELASVLVEEALSEDKQIIMTTHSEHIIGRLLTLVAEKNLTPDDLAIYAFEKDEKGECSASQLGITEDGKVVGGIKDFFETDLDELERYINALKASE